MTAWMVRSACHTCALFRAFCGLSLAFRSRFRCVMRREQWEFVRDRFFDAYRLQKTAYRHANGGSGAPNVHDEVVPKFQPMTSDLEERLKLAQGPRLVAPRL